MGLDKIFPAKLREPLSLLPTKMIADTTPEFSPAASQPAKGTVGFVRGCVMSVMFGDTNASSVRLLNRAGSMSLRRANRSVAERFSRTVDA